MLLKNDASKQSLILHSLYKSFAISLVLTLLVFTMSTSEINLPLYFAFSSIFCWIFILSLYSVTSEYISLINVLICLGFWMKLTFYFITNQPFAEPAGSTPMAFVNNAMLKLLIVGTITLLVYIFYLFNNKHYDLFKLKSISPLKNNRTNYFYATAAISLLLSIINWKIGFLRIGLPNISNLQFPFTLILSWSLGIGLIFISSLLLNSKNKTELTSYLLLTTAISITLISRNSIMLAVYPLTLSIFRIKATIRRKFFLILGLGLFMLSNVAIITKMRNTLYTNEPRHISQSREVDFKAHFGNLFFKRWIGIEGVLVALQNKSDDSFLTMLFENPKKSSESIYQSLAQSNFLKSKNFLFYTFPGSIGFIFFAKSIYLTITSSIFLLVVIYISNLAILQIPKGTARSVTCWWSAASITQISLFPLFNLKIYSFYLLCILVVNYIFILNKNED